MIFDYLIANEHKIQGWIDICETHKRRKRMTTNHLTSLVVACSLLLGSVNAQPDHIWSKSFDDTNASFGNAITIDSDHNVIVVGTYRGMINFDPDAGNTHLHPSYGWNDGYVVKFDSSGNVLWSSTFGGNDLDGSYGIATDRQNNVLHTGYFRGSCEFRYIGGTQHRVSHGTSNMFITKFDPQGSILWLHSIGGTGSAGGVGIVCDHSENVIVLGGFSGKVDFDPGPDSMMLESRGSGDVVIAKFDANGIFNWAISFGGRGRENSAGGIAIDHEGNVVVSGNFEDTVDFDPGPAQAIHISKGNDDMFLAKYDPSGNLIWVNAFGGVSLDKSESISLNSKGEVMICGMVGDTVDLDPSSGKAMVGRPGVSDYTVFIAKYSSGGDYLWSVEYDRAINEHSNPFDLSKPDVSSIATDTSDNLFVIGCFADSVDFDPGFGTDLHIVEYPGTVSNYDMFLAKYNSDGQFLWVMKLRNYNDFVSGEWGTDVVVDPMGGIAITGKYGQTLDFDPGPDSALLYGEYGNIGTYVAKYKNPPHILCAVSVENLSTIKITDTKARLSWNPVAMANHYLIRGNAARDTQYVHLTISDPNRGQKQVSGLLPNTSYSWQIKAVCDSAGERLSEWAPWEHFRTKCLSPSNHWVDNIEPTSARLRWNPVSDASGYEIRGRELGGSFVKLTVGRIVHHTVNQLRPSTTYEWQIKSLCENNSKNTDLVAFSTPPAKTSDVIPLESNEDQIITVIPNPSSDHATIYFSNPEKQSYELYMYDLSGNIVFNRKRITGEEIQISADRFPKGVYFIELKGETILIGRLTIQ